MKKSFLGRNVFYVVLVLLLFTACKKEYLPSLRSEPNSTVSAERPQAIAMSNNLVLETFTHADAINSSRQYRFVYAPNGTLDSIVVTGNPNYVYRVFYEGAHLDSINLVLGRIASTITNYQYKGDLLTGFDYYDRHQNFSFPTSYLVSYDKRKRIQAIESSFQNRVLNRKEFSYDDNDNVVTWHDSFSANNATYTYDSRLNPFHLVPDLFAIMIEEQWIWEYVLSLHNLASKTYSSGQNVSYLNQYNYLGQLATKSFNDINHNGNNTFSFMYK